MAGTRSSTEPARYLHCDYTLHGMMQLIAHSEQAFAEAGAAALAAYNGEGSDGINGSQPRVAAYSVWRPLKTVKRDPLVVAAWKSISPDDMVKATYQAKGTDGDYTMESWALKPSKDAKNHRWYWLPEQKAEEALIFKFADTESVNNEDIAAWTAHGSPQVLGSEDEEARESVEARVLAFW